MQQLNITEDKISAKFPELREYVKDLNSIREMPVRITLAVEDDITHGVAIWEPGNLIYLVVAEGSRRSGVGSFLLKYVQLNSDRQMVMCRVHPSNIDGLCFFSKKGFQIDRWFIASDSRRYFRMTNSNVDSSYAPPEEGYLVDFIENTPIFLSVADKIY